MAATSIEYLKLHSEKSRFGGNHKGMRVSARTPFDMKRLAWPSGRGDEYGVVFTDLKLLWDVILRNGNSSQFDGVSVIMVKEADARAIMVEGLNVGPVSFASEPGMPEDRLAIIADASADRVALQRHLKALLTGLKVVV